MSRKIRGNLMLTLTAVIWGTSFVAQSVGMDYIEPFTFGAARMFLAGVALLIVVFVMSRLKKRDAGETEPAVDPKAQRRLLVIGGICCGAALFVASTLQQFGILYTTAGKAGFITALYIVLVPIFGLFLKKRVPRTIWVSVVIAVAGLYLLCINEGFSIGLGDTLVILCAVCFAVHILVIDHFSPKVNGVKMSCIQFFVASALSVIPMLIFETPSLGAILDGFFPVFYAGVLSGGMGYTLQIVAQRDTDPTVASLILSMESVFAVVTGGLVLHEVLRGREIFGCLLMLAAVILAQLPEKKPKDNPAVNDRESS